jgi:hypothetical protein
MRSLKTSRAIGTSGGGSSLRRRGTPSLASRRQLPSSTQRPFRSSAAFCSGAPAVGSSSPGLKARTSVFGRARTTCASNTRSAAVSRQAIAADRSGTFIG